MNKPPFFDALREYGETHYVTVVISDPILSAHVHEDRAAKTIEGNVSFYNVTLPISKDSGVESSLLLILLDVFYSPEFEKVKIEPLFAALCLRYLFGKSILLQHIMSTGGMTLPQLEWYVKDIKTGSIVAASTNYIFIGSPYAFTYPGKYIPDSDGPSDDILFMQWNNYQKLNLGNPLLAVKVFSEVDWTTSFYGKAINRDTPLYLVYTLCDRTYKLATKTSGKHLAHIARISQGTVAVVENPALKPNEVKPVTYSYLTDKDGILKVSLLGEYVNER